MPSPWPLPPASIVSQGFSEDAVHAHSRAVVTAIAPVPPAAGSGVSGPVTDTPHLDTVAGEVIVVDADEPQAETATAASTGPIR